MDTVFPCSELTRLVCSCDITPRWPLTSPSPCLQLPMSHARHSPIWAGCPSSPMVGPFPVSIGMPRPKVRASGRTEVDGRIRHKIFRLPVENISSPGLGETLVSCSRWKRNKVGNFSLSPSHSALEYTQCHSCLLSSRIGPTCRMHVCRHALSRSGSVLLPAAANVRGKRASHDIELRIPDPAGQHLNVEVV